MKVERKDGHQIIEHDGATHVVPDGVTTPPLAFGALVEFTRQQRRAQFHDRSDELLGLALELEKCLQHERAINGHIPTQEEIDAAWVRFLDFKQSVRAEKPWPAGAEFPLGESHDA
jgi:hypothetical protein